MLYAHPAFREPVRSARVELDGDADRATEQTIRYMAGFAAADAASPEILRIADGLRGRSPDETVRNAWQWVRARVQFVPDSTLAAPLPAAADITEILVRPVDMLSMHQAAGDCDDFSMLGASLFLALGVPVSFVTVAADPTAPDQYSHVYLCVGGEPGIAFDASHGAYLGWEVPNAFGKRARWDAATGGLQYEAGPRGTARAPGLSGIVGMGLTQPTDPWWQTLIQNVGGVLPDILKARYAVPPSGTLIQTPTGMISRVDYPSGFGVQLNTPGQSIIPSWVWLAGGAALLFVATRERK